MTLRGLIIVALELLMIILAFGTEFRNFLIIALCIGGVLLYSLLSLVLASFSLGAKAEIDNNSGLRGEKIKYTFTVYGVSLLPTAAYFFVKTTNEKFSLNRKFRHSFMLLPSFSVKRKFVFEMPCAHIGEWEIGIKKMRLEDLFGLFSLPMIWCRKGKLLKKITVFPNIHSFGDIEARDSSGGFGITNLLNCENGELMGDSREYIEGDSLKRVNWKLSARTKKLHSRMYETPQEPSVAVVMDAVYFGESADNIIDISCETTISLAQYFLSQNIDIKLCFVRLQGERDVLANKLTDVNDIYKIHNYFTNTLFSKSKEDLRPDVLEGAQVLSANRIYLVTSNPSDALISEFVDINKRGMVACCIVPSDKPKAVTNSVAAINEISRIELNTPDEIVESVGVVL